MSFLLNSRAHRTRRHSVRRTVAKKAVSAIISWVLIVGFVISLGAIVSRFMVDFTKEQTKSTKKVVFDTDECRSLALSIDTSCHDISAETLNLTITNRNFAKIEKLLYKVFTENNKPFLSGELDFPLNPDRKKELVLNASTVPIGYVELIPVTFKEQEEIICTQKKATVDDVLEC